MKNLPKMWGKMKRISLAFFLFLLCALGARAQSTTVSGTITDSNGQSFNFGTYKIEFFSNGLPTPFFWNGTPFDMSTHFAGALDATGSFAGVVVPSSNFITPVGTAWRFTVCSAATTSQCYAQIVTVTGTTLNVTGLIVPVPIVVNANQFSQPAAYTDGEIAGPILGFTYYPINTNCLRVYTGGAPPVWQNICGGGGGGGLTSFSAGNLPPLFTTSVANPTTTPALSFILSNAGGGTVFGNPTGATGSPLYTINPVLGIPGASAGTLGFAGSTSGTVTVRGQATAGSWTLQLPVNAGTNGYFLQTNGAGITSWQPAPGGGTGCTLSGTDTGVVTEHPIGTCRDSIDFTWDDGASKQNLQAGDGTNTNTSAQDTFILGISNSTNSCKTCSAIGSTNVLTAPADEQGSGQGGNKYAVGFGHTLTGGLLGALGANCTVQEAYAVTCVGSSSATAPASSFNGVFSQLTDGSMVGTGNTVSVTGAGGMNDFGTYGDVNTIAATSGHSIQTSYTVGFTNRIKTTTGDNEAFLFGLDNESDGGANSDVAIFGQSNTSSSMVQDPLSSGDSTIVGSHGVMTAAGGGFIAGMYNQVTSCTLCAAVGINVHLSANNTLALGMSNTPEMVITAGKVKLNAALVLDPHPLQIVAAAFSSLGTCNSGTEGSMAAVTDSTTNTWGATISGSGTNHVLAYCDGTNWTVMGK